MEERKVLFNAEKIDKHYGATHALKGVQLKVHEGEIVGIIGENGAGKSTLLKIIIGSETADFGKTTMRGLPYEPKNPMDANSHGVGMVFQEQSLIVSLTVGQNIFFGHEKKFSICGVINWPKLYRNAKEVLEEVDVKLNPLKRVSDLNFATRQMIEIAKVINVTRTFSDSSDKKKADQKCLILLDEPTSVLSEDETKNLFKQMRKIAARGHGVVFISHRLDEVLEITDRIYVYKDGEDAGNVLTKEANEAQLYEMMVGRASTNEYFQLDKQTEPLDEALLEVKNLGMMGVFKDINFRLHRGEILGVCGVIGSGKEELCEVICGDEKPTAGEIILKGKAVNFSSPASALENGILMIPKERLVESIVRIESVENNIAFSNLKSLVKGLFIPAKKVREQAHRWIKDMRIKTSGPKELLIRLSGGNQQKVVFSRALASESDVLLLNHPTRGVDVGAKEEIYTTIREMVSKGKAVLLLGDTLDECIGMSNRVLVMKDGLITGEFNAPPDNKPSQVDVVSHMM
ncbi:MAG: sugar ABC transporter ATP-binding protein [Treponema sp.]|nr:sugar ABC transporter ATP-binding protein [Treponema sp.]